RPFWMTRSSLLPCNESDAASLRLNAARRSRGGLFQTRWSARVRADLRQPGTTSRAAVLPQICAHPGGLVREPSASQVLKWTTHPGRSGLAGIVPAGPFLSSIAEPIAFGVPPRSLRVRVV